MSSSKRPSDRKLRRFPLNNSNLSQHATVAPWAEAVEVPSSHTILFLSGFVASPLGNDVDAQAIDAFGDMEQQTRSALTSIRESLEPKGYTMTCIVKLVVYYKDIAEGIDLEGFGRAYRECFSEEEPLPARSRVIVSRLLNPGWLLEIEAVAAVSSS